MQKLRNLIIRIFIFVPKIIYDVVWRFSFSLFSKLSTTLDEKTIDPDPIKQFSRWFDEAQLAHRLLPNAMVLSTSDNGGKPSGRVVLLKEFNERGFVFYSNYTSRKGKELRPEAPASLTFYWPEIVRQVRIEGIVEKISAEESDLYFQTRPRKSQLGACASPQSEVVGSREDLDQKFRDLEKQYRNKPVPRPPHWGGYRLKPAKIEFWQGRIARLHDRVLYEKTTAGNWEIKRLAP